MGNSKRGGRDKDVDKLEEGNSEQKVAGKTAYISGAGHLRCVGNEYRVDRQNRADHKTELERGLKRQSIPARKWWTRIGEG